jgi:hypothetical protein
MDIYFLGRILHNDNYVGSDEAESFVVITDSELSARYYAADNAGDEGADTWVNTALSFCRHIGFARKNAVEGVVCRSFNAG